MESYSYFTRYRSVTLREPTRAVIINLLSSVGGEELQYADVLVRFADVIKVSKKKNGRTVGRG